MLFRSVLNGTILFILITCTLATVVGQKGAQNIALADTIEEVAESGTQVTEERILIPMKNISTVDELVDLSVTVKSHKALNGIYALHVADNTMADDVAEKYAGKLLEKAAVAASSTDCELNPLIRYDSDVVNGIACVIREQKITDLILGLHHKSSLKDGLLGSSLGNILGRCNITTFIYKPVQPLATIRRTILVIPSCAENEIGFVLWMQKLTNIISNTGSKLVVYATKQTITHLKEVYSITMSNAEIRVFKDWDDFLIVSREIKNDDNLIVVMSRKNHLSYHSKMAKMPIYLSRYFQKNSFILIYPVQVITEDDTCEDTPVQTIKKTFLKFDVFSNFFEKIHRKTKSEFKKQP